MKKIVIIGLLFIVSGLIFILVYSCCIGKNEIKEMKVAICHSAFSNKCFLLDVSSNGQIEASKGTWNNTSDIDSDNFMNKTNTKTIQLKRSQIFKLNRLFNKVERFDGRSDGCADCPFLIFRIGNDKTYFYLGKTASDKHWNEFVETLFDYCEDVI